MLEFLLSIIIFIIGVVVGYIAKDKLSKGEQLSFPGLNDASAYLTSRKIRRKPKVIDEQEYAANESFSSTKPNKGH